MCDICTLCVRACVCGRTCVRHCNWVCVCVYMYAQVCVRVCNYADVRACISVCGLHSAVYVYSVRLYKEK